jgi:hypothetical protein
MPARLRLLCWTLLALVLISVASLSSCVLALGVQQHLSGDNLPYALPSLDPGATREEVVSSLGEPSLPAEDQGGLLRWHEVIRPRECRMYLLGFIPLGREPRQEREVEARFDEGRLVRADVTYLDRRGRVESIESLLRTEPDSSTPAAGQAPEPLPQP